MEVVFVSDAVRDEYARWHSHFGENDPYDHTDTVGILDVLRAHFLIADYFFEQGSGMGGIGPKSPELLHSAVYRQFVSFAGRDKWNDPYHKAATLVFGIVKDHPFHDANKRTGFLTMLYALHKMKRIPTAPHRDWEELTVKIAEGSLNTFSRARELAKKDDDADVLFLADYLKRNSHARDNSYYTITFRELDRRLRDFGFCLHNPNGNYIDVSRIEEKRGILGFGQKKTKLVRLGQIGFPSWKTQVSRTAISKVRSATGLTPEKGVDSKSFFHGADALNSIIDEFSDPLRRLAFR
jgi:prophage maintenance system killer protein